MWLMKNKKLISIWGHTVHQTSILGRVGFWTWRLGGQTGRLVNVLERLGDVVVRLGRVIEGLGVAEKSFGDPEAPCCVG